MNLNNKNGGMQLGTTLYSLTTEFHSRQYGFEQLVRKIAEQGLGPGLEVVGFQSIKGFPVITEQFASSFKALIDETGLVLSCLGINADAGINRNQRMNEDELVEYHAHQLEAAATLGFPVVRYQYGAGPNVISRLVPLAEKLGVKLGLEIHAPNHLTHPDILQYRELYEREKSPMLGFIPDFGTSTHSVPPSFIDYARSIGAPEDLISIALENWNLPKDGMEKIASFYQDSLAAGFDERFIVELYPMFGLFGKMPPEDWAEIIPQTVHIHGKFFDFDETGNEVSIDHQRNLKVFVEGGYQGFMSSEYEGHHWTDSDGFAKLRAHHALVKKILASF